MIEALRDYVHSICFNHVQEITLTDFKDKNFLSFGDHGNLAFNSEYILKIRDFFKKPPAYSNKITYFNNFKCNEIKDEILLECGLHFIQSESETLIALPLREYDLTQIQKKRIAQLNIDCRNQNLLPHFLR